MSNVRSKTGAAIAGDFDSSTGTPVVINQTTGDGYVLKADGTIVKIGAGASDSSTLAAAATNIIPVDAASDTTTSVVLVGTPTGSQVPLTDAGITYNASTNILSTNLDGAVNGTVGVTTPAAGRFTTLTATGTTTLDTSLTGALRADAGVVSAGGIFLLQNLNVTTGAFATGSTAIPNDDTIPQNTEGDQYMALAITPKNASSILEITVVLFGTEATNTSDAMTVALFQDAIVGALAAGQTQLAGTMIGVSQVTFTHRMTAGSTSEIIFKVRAGLNNANPFNFNGVAGARKLGGVISSSITIKEYLH